MKQLQLGDQKFRSLYKEVSTEFKNILENAFGKDFFSTKITDRINSYEDACAELGEIPLDEKTLKEHGFTEVEITRRKIETITRAYNEGWEADFCNPDQKKWRVWIKGLSSGGFVFYDTTCYGYSSAGAGNGSRLWFKSEECAKDAWDKFSDYYIILTKN